MVAWSRKTHEEFVEDMRKNGIKYLPMEPYKGASVKIAFKCDKCGHIWKAKPTNILSGRGCPQCKAYQAKKRNIGSDSDFRKRMKAINPDIQILSEYSGYKNKVLARCEIHNIEWQALPSSLLKGCGCRECRSIKIHNAKMKSERDFLKEVEKTFPNIEILGKYVNAKTKIKLRCRLHNEIYYATPDTILRGSGNCPKCKMTAGETKVAEYLEKSGYDYIPQYIFPDTELGNKRFDFYIPFLNLCIEFDGIEHFEPVPNFGGMKTFDHIKNNNEAKTNFCKSKGVKLIRVPYWERDVDAFLKASGL